MPEGVPLQSLSRLPGWPIRCGGRLRLPEVPLPFDDVPRSGPVCSGPSGSATVPTPGFLTPSPVSWLRSSSRVCFTPLPSLGSALPSERSPRVRSRAPRRGRWLLHRSSRKTPCATSAVLSPWTFTDSGDVRASSLARSCPELEAPFQRRARTTSRPHAHDTSRSPWTTNAGPTPGPSVPSILELSSLRESVHTARRSPVARRPVLSWAFSPLQSLAPAKPGALSPAAAGGVPPPAGTARLSARRATPGTPVRPCVLLPRGTSAPVLETLDVGWTPRGRPKRPARCPSAVTVSFDTGRAACPAAASTPMTFDARANPRPHPSHRLEIVGSRAHLV